MHVNYRVTETDSGSVISVFGDIDLANANLLADALFSLIETRSAVWVDLRGLRYIDSVGLHILLRAGQRAQRLGCDVTLVAVRPIHQLVEQVGLHRLMPVLDDLPAAEAPAPRTAPAAPQPAAMPPLASPSNTASIASGRVTQKGDPEPDVEPDLTPSGEPSRSDS